MKTKKELNELKAKYNSLKEELSTLTEEELKTVVGGIGIRDDVADKKHILAGYDVEYNKDGNEECSTDAPIDAGTYKAKITL